MGGSFEPTIALSSTSATSMNFLTVLTSRLFLEVRLRSWSRTPVVVKGEVVVVDPGAPSRRFRFRPIEGAS